MADRWTTFKRRIKGTGLAATIAWMLSGRLRPHFWLARTFMLAIDLPDVDSRLADEPPMPLKEVELSVEEVARLRHPFREGKIEALRKREARGARLRVLVGQGDTVLGFVSWVLRQDYYDENLSHLFRLADNETYTQEAAIHPAHRGVAMGKFISALHLRRMQELGLTRHYSMTEAINAPSIRMQDHGSLHIIRVYLFLEMLGRVRFIKLIKDKEAGLPGPGRFRSVWRARPPRGV